MVRSNASPAAGAAAAASTTRRTFDRSWLQNLLSKHASKMDPKFPCQSDPLLQNKALVVAPMVDQSDLPFRLLCRRYGSNLAYTPMIHARMFNDRPTYREKFWNFVSNVPEEDRPLVAQFCGSDPVVCLKAMKSIQHAVDAVDINCGCPQHIAKKGKYGAFLLENPELPNLVRHLASNLDVPVTVKVRVLPTGIDDSLNLYEKLVDAGASLITVHGRNRHQNKQYTGAADWDAIRRTVERIGDRVPVIANGSISNLDDVRECIRQTGVDGVMSSEAILEYPALFLETGTEKSGNRRTGPGRTRLAREFLDLCKQYPPDEGGQASGLKCIRAHLHKMLHADLQVHCTDVRDLVAFGGKTMDVMYDAVKRVEESQVTRGHQVEDEVLSWYVRHRMDDADEPESGEKENKKAIENSVEASSDDNNDDDDDECLGADLFGIDDGEQCGCGDEYGDY